MFQFAVIRSKFFQPKVQRNERVNERSVNRIKVWISFVKGIPSSCPESCTLTGQHTVYIILTSATHIGTYTYVCISFLTRFLCFSLFNLEISLLFRTSLLCLNFLSARMSRFLAFLLFGFYCVELFIRLNSWSLASRISVSESDFLIRSLVRSFRRLWS